MSNATCTTLGPSSLLSLSITYTFLSILFSCYYLLHFLYLHCLRRPTQLYRRYQSSTKTTSPWAIVTGPTSGIGLAIAKKLYLRGFSIVLVGRVPERLHGVKEQLEQLTQLTHTNLRPHNNVANTNTPNRIEVIEIDFATAKQQSLEAFTAMLTTHDVAVLVNNVGVATPLGYFTENDPKAIAALCEVNMRSCLLMTRLVLPLIVRRKSGGIVNLSSLSGLHASPMLATYAATKSFVHSLSMSLSEETSGFSYIDIQSVTPGFVATKMSVDLFGSHAEMVPKKNRATSMCCQCPPVVTANACAESILSQLGNGQRHTSGHWKHTVQNVLHTMTPKFVLADITHTCMLLFQKTKRREEGGGGGERKETWKEDEGLL